MRKITRITVEIEEQGTGQHPRSTKCSSIDAEREWEISGPIFPRHLKFLATVSDAAREADKNR